MTDTLSPTPPRFACALQLFFFVGGLGYLVRKRWAHFGVTFAAVAALEGVIFFAAINDYKALSAVTLPIIFTIQLLSALDLYKNG